MKVITPKSPRSRNWRVVAERIRTGPGTQLVHMHMRKAGVVLCTRSGAVWIPGNILGPVLCSTAERRTGMWSTRMRTAGVAASARTQ